MLAEQIIESDFQNKYLFLYLVAEESVRKRKEIYVLDQEKNGMKENEKLVFLVCEIGS